MRMCHLYVSSEVGPEWPPLAPGDCGKVARFSLYPLICAHLRSSAETLLTTTMANDAVLFLY